MSKEKPPYWMEKKNEIMVNQITQYAIWLWMDGESGWFTKLDKDNYKVTTPVIEKNNPRIMREGELQEVEKALDNFPLPIAWGVMAVGFFQLKEKK